MNFIKFNSKNNMKRIIKILKLTLSGKIIFTVFLYFLISILATFGELFSTYLISNFITSSLYIDLEISNDLNYLISNHQLILGDVF